MPIQAAVATDVVGRVEFNAAYAEGLSDIAGFSHLLLLCHLHRVRGSALTVTPFLDDQPTAISLPSGRGALSPSRSASPAATSVASTRLTRRWSSGWRLRLSGTAISVALRKAVAEGVQQVEQAQTKASAYRQRQQQRNRVAADDADVIAELGRWDGTSLSDEAWDADLGIEREDEA